MNPSLLNVDAEQAKHPFSGRPPPRSLEEFFSDVLDRDLLEDFSTPRGDLVTQSNIAASTVESLHNKANNRMRKEGILLDQDDYTGRDSSSKTVCRPPFDSLHIMSAPWLSRYNRGKVPHVGVFSTKHMLLFHANGWQQSSCVYFSEDSTIPSSILNGSAWSSTQETEGRSIIERLQMSSFNESTTTEDDSLEITFEKTEPVSWHILTTGRPLSPTHSSAAMASSPHDWQGSCDSWIQLKMNSNEALRCNPPPSHWYSRWKTMNSSSISSTLPDTSTSRVM